MYKIGGTTVPLNTTEERVQEEVKNTADLQTVKDLTATTVPSRENQKIKINPGSCQERLHGPGRRQPEEALEALLSSFEGFRT